MELRRRSSSAAAKASDALPLPLHLTNAVFFTLFFSLAYYLLNRWRDKIRTSSPLHLLTLSDIVAIFAFLASFIYLLGFFGIHFVQSFVATRPNEEGLVSPPSPTFQCIDKADNENTDGSVSKVARRPPFQYIDRTDNENINVCSVRKEMRVPPFDRANENIVDSVVKVASRPPLQCTKPISTEFIDNDNIIVDSVINGTVPSYSLESRLGDCRRAATIRREVLQRVTGRSLAGLPLEGFDYEAILGQCCEMPVGYVQVPVGVAGPLLLDGAEYTVPMATTEGCLVASTNRGCKAIYVSGGASSVVLRDAMSRAPVVRFATANRAAELKFFLEDPLNFDTLAVVFNKSSRFGRLQSIKCSIAGKNVYARFTCSTGDAMGMNMVSKGVQNVLDFLQSDFPDMDVIGITGNYCADKKPAAVNWIEGRGKSVVCEAIIKEDVVKKVLKTNVAALVELNMLKNLAGSAVAGAIGGFNAHASNIVSAIFIATGQDPAQNVESSHCITMMEAVNDGKDLHISVTMPSIEVGTVGGGTQLPSQSACLNLLGVKGASKDSPGSNSRLLATIVAGSVLAGELSLMSAIAAGQLVKSHMKYNRSSKDMSKVSS